MFPFTLKDIVEVLEKLKPYFKIIWGMALAVAICPMKLLELFGLAFLWTSYKPYIGFILLFGIVGYIVSKLEDSKEDKKKEKAETKKKDSQYKEEQEVLNRLSSLAPEEMMFVWYCLYRNRDTVYLHALDPRAVSLKNKGIFESGTFAGNALCFPITMRDFVWKHVQENREQFLPKYVLSDQNFHLIMDDIDYKVRRYIH